MGFVFNTEKGLVETLKLVVEQAKNGEMVEL